VAKVGPHHGFSAKGEQLPAGISNFETLEPARLT